MLTEVITKFVRTLTGAFATARRASRVVAALEAGDRPLAEDLRYLGILPGAFGRIGRG